MSCRFTITSLFLGESIGANEPTLSIYYSQYAKPNSNSCVPEYNMEKHWEYWNWIKEIIRGCCSCLDVNLISVLNWWKELWYTDMSPLPPALNPVKNASNLSPRETLIEFTEKKLINSKKKSNRDHQKTHFLQLNTFSKL